MVFTARVPPLLCKGEKLFSKLYWLVLTLEVRDFKVRSMKNLILTYSFYHFQIQGLRFYRRNEHPLLFRSTILPDSIMGQTFTLSPHLPQ